MKVSGLDRIDTIMYNRVRRGLIKVYNIILEEVLVRRICKIPIDPFMFRFIRSASNGFLYHVIKYVNTILDSSFLSMNFNQLRLIDNKVLICFKIRLSAATNTAMVSKKLCRALEVRIFNLKM